MNIDQSIQGATGWRLEQLEPRLLLSAAMIHDSAILGEGTEPPAILVTADLEAESNGGPTNNDLASAQELTFANVLTKARKVDGTGPQQAVVIGTADGLGGETYENSWVVVFLEPAPSWQSQPGNPP